jgi:hypothetical protein
MAADPRRRRPVGDAEKQENYERAEKLLAEQNFAAAVIAGAVATAIAVFAFVIIVSRWPIAYGFVAREVSIRRMN